MPLQQRLAAEMFGTFWQFLAVVAAQFSQLNFPVPELDL